MKKLIASTLLLTLGLAPLATQAQQPPATPPPTNLTAEPKLSSAQLDTLVGPIALYPDPMIAIILPASTVPTDVMLAARYLRDGKDAAQIDNQAWDPSVKALARYPDVVYTMDENLEWTNQLGAAVIAQQADVMAAIQTQRAKANSLGNLTSTPQQQVIVQKEVIQIVPADPQIIYVPQYNPQVVYVEKADPVVPLITFGLGLAMGAWLANDCDWNNHGFYVNNYGPGGWHGYSNTQINNNVNINVNNNNNYWRPNPNRPQPRPPYNPNRPGSGGNGNIPSFRPPPQGGWNNGNSGYNRPGTGGNNRPGGNGGNSGGNNRPNFPGNSSNKPGNGGNSGPKFPGISDAGGGNGQNKPGGGSPNFPGAGNGNKPGNGFGGTKPAERPAQNNKPAFGGGNGNGFNRENSKREPAAKAPASRPSQQGGGQQRPAHQAQAKPAQRPAAKPQPQAQRQAPSR